jgi:hypothetical protein
MKWNGVKFKLKSRSHCALFHWEKMKFEKWNVLKNPYVIKFFINQQKMFIFNLFLIYF